MISPQTTKLDSLSASPSNFSISPNTPNVPDPRETPQNLPIAPLSRINFSELKSSEDAPYANSKKLNEIKKHFQKGQFESKSFTDYSQFIVQQLSGEFTQIRSHSLPRPSLERWSKLTDCLKYEHDPRTLHERGVHGCSYLYYAISLSLFLKTECSGKVTGLAGLILSSALKRLDTLLKPCTAISNAVGALKLSPPATDYAKTFKILLNNNLQIEIEKNKEVLIPLGWLYKAPIGGHLILVKATAESANSVKIKIFDPQPTVDSDFGESKTPELFSTCKLPASLTILRKTSPSDLLDDIYNLLPLQIPHNISSRVENDPQPNPIKDRALPLYFLASKVNYTVIGKGLLKSDECTVIRSEAPSPLDTINYVVGKNCVPAAFRMLIYTLAKEEAVKAEIDTMHHSDLKSACDAFLNDYKSFVIRHTSNKAGKIV